jgi:1-deoxy-D-xylulose-5-phosphate reductoisomerase
MNKGLEMIEAKWMFNLANEQVDVVVHPQSIIHSMVQFTDGSVKSQMGLPDMKLPIQYALGYPQRITNNYKRVDFKEYSKLTFEPVDYKTFRNLEIARTSMFKGGNTSCVMNAANEVVVNAFLHNKVGFLEMSDMIEKTIDSVSFIEHPTLEDYISSDIEAREYAAEFVKKSQLSMY